MANPPRPMVVVYSGDRERPDRWWDEGAAMGDVDGSDADTPTPPDPALSAREPRSSAASVHDLSPIASDEADSVAQFSTIIPPAGTRADASESEAPVALSSAASFLPPKVQGIPVPSGSEPPAELVAERLRAKRERASTVRRGALVIVGAFLSAYLVTQRVTLRSNESTRALADKVAEAPAKAVVDESPTSPAAEPPPATVPEQFPARATSAAEPLLPPPSAEGEASAEAEAPSPVPAAPENKSVVIELVPWDAKLLLAGVAQPGPPFVVTIPAGKRVAFEVARRGYIPRRVVVDGSEEKLTIGLIRPKGARVEAPASAAPHSPDGEAEDSNKDPRVRVRSGL